MKSDYRTLLNIFEMSELLKAESVSFTDLPTLEVETFDENSGEHRTVVFVFNQHGELVEVNLQ